MITACMSDTHSFIMRSYKFSTTTTTAAAVATTTITAITTAILQQIISHAKMLCNLSDKQGISLKALYWEWEV